LLNIISLSDIPINDNPFDAGSEVLGAHKKGTRKKKRKQEHEDPEIQVEIDKG
jgi:hypothetical protein